MANQWTKERWQRKRFSIFVCHLPLQHDVRCLISLREFLPACFLFFDSLSSLSSKEPAALILSFTAGDLSQWAHQIFLESILWLALQLSSTFYHLIPPTACTSVDILISYNSRLRWGFIAIRPGISADKEKRLNHSGNIRHPQFSSFHRAVSALLLNSSLRDWPLLLIPVYYFVQLVPKHPVSTIHC